MQIEPLFLQNLLYSEKDADRTLHQNDYMVESYLKFNIEGGGFSKEANVSLETKLLLTAVV